ncbi:unnamed protein product [Prorocentrum cordatum]|uniref:PH domain-containing protein n=1 Tax=Prorocentrum cordatum TaxID=2364126 RepID=A0ABN9UQS5_9DINO|nr:unnamed protein product [Polarella glacialis]
MAEQGLGADVEEEARIDQEVRQWLDLIEVELRAQCTEFVRIGTARRSGRWLVHRDTRVLCSAAKLAFDVEAAALTPAVARQEPRRARLSLRAGQAAADDSVGEPSEGSDAALDAEARLQARAAAGLEARPVAPRAVSRGRRPRAPSSARAGRAPPLRWWEADRSDARLLAQGPCVGSSQDPR